jgi:DNA invertase Pin-like site-specific DNA recombinase
MSNPNDTSAGVLPTKSFQRQAEEHVWGTLKIKPYHREQLAVVYIRQSTQQQVLENRESTERQYDLVHRAVQLGWHRDRVVVIDEDQGQSGKTAEGRLGFQRLLAEVGLDHVGLVLGLEMSRLARSNKDWHQLLELCALFRTLLADQDGLYDPTDFNDRLLLGLKGTMSEAELHLLKSRLEQGRRNKARRGELFNHVPIGYVLLPNGEVVLDPDEQVRMVVHLVLDKFAELGSIASVSRHLNQHGIRLGVRPIAGSERGQLEWRHATRITLRNMLKHPMYAGAYCYGRQAVDLRRKVPGRRKSGTRRLPRDQWLALLRDRLPAYITWEQYERNQQQLQQNQTRNKGTPREGIALLSGLLFCGRCSAKMRVLSAKRLHPRYHCSSEHAGMPRQTCQGLSARELDKLVSQLVLNVLEPAALELSLCAAEDLDRERQQLHQNWRQRLERACYNTQRAERQYRVVEPENRLVARELESRWEQSLREKRSLQEEYDRFQSDRPAAVTDAERARILSLATNIPALWNAAATSNADRKTIVRLLIERVVVQVQGNTELADVAVHWIGGYVSYHEIVRRVSRLEQLRDCDQFMQRAMQLRSDNLSSPQIAAQLNAEGYRTTAKREPFKDYHIRQFFRRRGLVKSLRDESKDHLLHENEWWPRDLARKLVMPRGTLMSWRAKGWIQGRRVGERGRWALWADADEMERLERLRVCPQGWPDQPYPAELTTPKERSDV